MLTFELEESEIENFISIIDSSKAYNLMSKILKIKQSLFDIKCDILYFKTKKIICLEDPKVFLLIDENKVNKKKEIAFLWTAEFLTTKRIVTVPIFYLTIISKKKEHYVSIVPITDFVYIVNNQTNRPKIIGEKFIIEDKNYEVLLLQIQNMLSQVEEKHSRH